MNAMVLHALEIYMKIKAHEMLIEALNQNLENVVDLFSGQEFEEYIAHCEMVDEQLKACQG